MRNSFYNKCKNRIPLDIIVEMGLLRKRNECALCGKTINIKDYHIQLCKKCRLRKLKTMVTL